MSAVAWPTEVAPDDLAACLKNMAPLRAAAVRAHLAGFALSEVMEMYGWSHDKALSLLAHGMAELRQQLGERGLSID